MFEKFSRSVLARGRSEEGVAGDEGDLVDQADLEQHPRIDVFGSSTHTNSPPSGR
jgi:hypothetical protein